MLPRPLVPAEQYTSAGLHECGCSAEEVLKVLIGLLRSEIFGGAGHLALPRPPAWRGLCGAPKLPGAYAPVLLGHI